MSPLDVREIPVRVVHAKSRNKANTLRDELRFCLVETQKKFRKNLTNLKYKIKFIYKFFLHIWVVNRETNLMMLINP